MKNLLFILLFFTACFSCSFGQENDSIHKSNLKIDFGLSGIFSASSYIENYNFSPSIGFDVKFFSGKWNNIKLESGLFLSERNLFSNKNYFVISGDCSTCDARQFYLNSISLFYTDIPILFQYKFLKTKRDALFSISGGILNSFKIAKYVKYKEFYKTKKEFYIERWELGNDYKPNYDLSILLGVNNEYKKKYSFGLYFQKGIRKFDTYSKELHPGSFNAILLKTTIFFNK